MRRPSAPLPPPPVEQLQSETAPAPASRSLPFRDARTNIRFAILPVPQPLRRSASRPDSFAAESTAAHSRQRTRSTLRPPPPAFRSQHSEFSEAFVCGAARPSDYSDSRGRTLRVRASMRAALHRAETAYHHRKKPNGYAPRAAPHESDTSAISRRPSSIPAARTSSCGLTPKNRAMRAVAFSFSGYIAISSLLSPRKAALTLGEQNPMFSFMSRRSMPRRFSSIGGRSRNFSIAFRGWILFFMGLRVG